MSVDLDLHFDPQGDTLAAARECEATVFLHEYGNTATQWAEEYGPYEPSSTFITITERGGDALATMRLIVPSEVGLKSLADVARAPWSIDGVRAARAAGMALAQTWDVATIAIRKRAVRHSLLSAAMYHALFRATRTNNIRWIVMIMDVRARRLLNASHIHTQLLPGTRPGPYLGSEASVPVWGDMPKMADRQRVTNPDAHRLINLGIGLDGIRVPEPAQFLHVRLPLVPVQPAVPAMRRIGLATA